MTGKKIYGLTALSTVDKRVLRHESAIQIAYSLLQKRMAVARIFLELGKKLKFLDSLDSQTFEHLKLLYHL
jgi:hypothetical protein